MQSVKPAVRLLDLPDELLTFILSFTINPTPLHHTCSRLHNLFTFHPVVRATWLSCQYGRKYALFNPWLHIDHPALDAATLLILLNTGADFKYSPLWPSNPGEEDEPTSGDIILELETKRQIAWDIICRVSRRQPSRRLSQLRDPFDLWCWAADRNDDISILERLVAAGADVNYRHSYAVHAAARRRRADLLTALFDTLNADIPAEQRKRVEWESSSGRIGRHSITFLLELLEWAPVNLIMSVLNRFDRVVYKDHLVFLQYIGRHNRVDVLTSLERGKSTSRSDPFVMNSDAARAIFVGAAEGGHLALLTEMVLKYSVPIDYDSSLALRLSARHVRPAMLLAVLSLNATLPSHHESRNLAIDLLSWGTPSCIVALLDRTDTRGPHPAIESSTEFLYRLGQCGRLDVLRTLQTLRRSWRLDPEGTNICLIGAAAGGHVELAKELVEGFGARPGVEALKAASGGIADTHEVILYLMPRCLPALETRDWGKCLIEACGIAGRGRVKVVKTLLDMGGRKMVREYGARAMVSALKTRQDGVADVVRKAMVGRASGERKMKLVEIVWDYDRSEGSLSGEEGAGKDGKEWEFLVPETSREIEALAIVVAKVVLKRKATHRLCGDVVRGSKVEDFFRKHHLIPLEGVQLVDQAGGAAGWDGWLSGVWNKLPGNWFDDQTSGKETGKQQKRSLKDSFGAPPAHLI
ncbi:hypothetical protein HK097_010975 [Rhizophlyctis rosea]|uniref:Ankyrin n=1 Tax=Rhizophlyctis rosea TaxID=64517 RepID=A0AAD5S995_9FUNG|nr:hypothetical protein HK097_010975 [Rhizophlyctis rosea]